jgi:hypothetical protein
MTAHRFLLFSWVAAAAILVEMLVIVKILMGIFKKQKRKQHSIQVATSPTFSTLNRQS